MQLLTSLPRGSPPWPPHLPQDMTRGPEEPLQGPPSGGLCSLHPLTYAPPPPPGADETPGSKDQAPPSRSLPRGSLCSRAVRVSPRVCAGVAGGASDRTGRGV